MPRSSWWLQTTGWCCHEPRISVCRKFCLIYHSSCRKDSRLLGEKWSRGIPIEVLAFAAVPVTRKIRAQLGGEPRLRMAANKAVRAITRFNSTFVSVCCGCCRVQSSLTTDTSSSTGCSTRHVSTTGARLTRSSSSFLVRFTQSLITSHKLLNITKSCC